MKSSSVRGLWRGIVLEDDGWFGTMRSSATTVPVSRATSRSHGAGAVGGFRSLRPPPMKRNPMSLVTFSGVTTTSQCFHTGCSTSASVSHFCDVRSIRVAVAPSAGSVFDTLHV
jgi:hypothetical protein